ncbi:RPA49 polymerase, partial [Chaetorhynchus papuensis]|nr:RPA49 polymerase [Chaetorhynchus papuensis]
AVRFANGKLRHPESLRFTAYRNRDTAHPRKRHRRILVSETERLCYVGHNFGSEVMKCNSLCRYFVGVLDKSSGQMEVYNAEIFNMQPLLSGGRCWGSQLLSCFVLLMPALFPWHGVRTIPSLLCADRDSRRGKHSEGVKQGLFLRDRGCGAGQWGLCSLGCTGCSNVCFCPVQMDLCIEAFGTSKQKRALSSRRMNAVGSDIVSTAVTKAAANIIDAKGVTALVQDMAQDDVQNISAFLPPCHEDADRPEHVYKFEDILSAAEYEALRVPAAALAGLSAEEVAKSAEERSRCSFVLEELKFLPTDEKSRDHKARCLWFLDTLIRFSHLKVIKKKHPMGPECPHIISRKLMKNFTSLTYNNGSIQNLISASMKAKITAYVIVLALHINNFQTDLTVLQNDMKLPESRILDIAKALRLRVSKAKGVPGLENDQNHKLGTLSLPLPMQKAPEGQRKRRKMN